MNGEIHVDFIELFDFLMSLASVGSLVGRMLDEFRQWICAAVAGEFGPTPFGYGKSSSS